LTVTSTNYYHCRIQWPLGLLIRKPICPELKRAIIHL